jgi:ABC-type transport system involved in multi-copper enzyme maturation permease subunit
MSIISIPLVGYTLKAALRDRLILIMIVAFVLSICMSLFMASAVVTEQDMFAAVFMAGGLRIFAVIGIILFACFYTRRLFENREAEYLLSRPISRPAFVLSIALAFSITALCFAALAVIAIAFSEQHPSILSFVIWSGSLVVELLIVVNAALFFSMVISSAAGSAMATMGFYVFARMIGQLIGISDSSSSLPAGDFLKLIFDFISMFMPRLDLMTQTGWLIYGVDNISESLIALAHSAMFIPVILLAAIFDLIRREF